MSGNTKRMVTMKECFPCRGVYLLEWTDLAKDPGQQAMTRITSLKEIEEKFPTYCEAVRECHADLNPGVDIMDYQMCAAYSFAENSPKRRRFQVYTHLAYVAGWADRTMLPEGLEKAIKATWSDVGEEFTGFQYN